MTVPLAGPPPPPAEKSRWDRFWLALKEEVGDFLSALKPLPTVVFVVGGLAMWLWVYYGGDVFFNEYFSPRLKEHGWALQSVGVARCCYFYGSAALFLCAFPHLALRITTRFTPEDPVPTAGWGLGDWRIGLPAYGIFYGVMLVILAVIARQPAFRAAYPLCDEATTPKNFLIYEAVYASYFISWEYFFRGFLLFGLEKSIGFWTVFVQMLPFVVMHFEKPSLEAMSSVFGGIALGYLALRTRSFWWGAFIHASVACTLDVIAFSLKHHWH